MPEYLRSLLQQTRLSELELLLAGFALAGLVTLLMACRKPLALWREEHLVRRVIRRLGATRLRNLRLSDGTGGEVTIDYVLLCPDGLCVIDIKRYHGLIFGGPRMDQWTQVVKRVSYKFPNPDGYLSRQISAVQALAPGVPVRGVHLFTHCARFPKDQPANVLSTRELKSLPQRPRLKDIPGNLRQAWKELAAAAHTSA